MMSQLVVTVHRNSVFEDSLELLKDLSSVDLKSPLKISFIDEHGHVEAGIDGGGLFKDFIECLLRVCLPFNQWFSSLPKLWSFSRNGQHQDELLGIRNCVLGHNFTVLSNDRHIFVLQRDVACSFLTACGGMYIQCVPVVFECMLHRVDKLRVAAQGQQSASLLLHCWRITWNSGIWCWELMYLVVC
jgi:hypothetical protein